jgi:hypothetical protein
MSGQCAAEGDVHHLHAAADREDRQLARPRRGSADLELVASGSASTVAECGSYP